MKKEGSVAIATICEMRYNSVSDKRNQGTEDWGL